MLWLGGRTSWSQCQSQGWHQEEHPASEYSDPIHEWDTATAKEEKEGLLLGFSLLLLLFIVIYRGYLHYIIPRFLPAASPWQWITIATVSPLLRSMLFTPLSFLALFSPSPDFLTPSIFALLQVGGRTRLPSLLPRWFPIT